MGRNFNGKKFLRDQNVFYENIFYEISRGRKSWRRIYHEKKVPARKFNRYYCCLRIFYRSAWSSVRAMQCLSSMEVGQRVPHLRLHSNDCKDLRDAESEHGIFRTLHWFIEKISGVSR